MEEKKEIEEEDDPCLIEELTPYQKYIEELMVVKTEKENPDFKYFEDL